MFVTNAVSNAGKMMNALRHCITDDQYRKEIPDRLRRLGVIGLKSLPTRLLARVDKAIWDNHKAEVIRYMLRTISEMPDEFTDELDLEMMLRGARLIGLDWPELDVMQRSVSSEMNKRMELDEATNKRYLDKLAKMLDDPDRPSWWTANDFEDLLKRRNAGPRLTKHDQKELLELLKENMVRWMLRIMRTGDMNDVRHMTWTLRSYGIAWPELITIERSLNAADKSQPKLDEDDDDEGLYGNEWRARLEYNEHLANLRDELKGNSPVDLVICLQEMGYLDLEMVLPERTMSDIRANKDKIIRSLLECMKFGDISRVGMTKAVMALNNIGINWPELDVIWKSLQAELSRKPVAESGQSDRAKQLLRDMDWMLKQNIPNGHYRAIATVILNMEHGGFGDREIGDLLSKHRKPIIHMLLGLLKGDDPAVGSALDNITFMVIHGIDWPELYDIIEQEKDNIMHWVLHEIAYQHTSKTQLPQLYSDLVKIGIVWPELDIIERSLKASAKGR